MKIPIIPCLGKFYNFVVMITVTLNNLLSILGIYYVQMQCRFEYALIALYIFNNLITFD